MRNSISSILYILLFLIFDVSSLRAQNSGANLNQDAIDEMKQEGQLFSVQISRDNPIRIFIVGKEEAKFDFAKINLTIRRLKPYPGKVLKINRFDNYFTINDSVDPRKPLDLEMVTTNGDKKEIFNFKLNQSVP